jgi:predicted ArsR family transcriptional regulator
MEKALWYLLTATRGGENRVRLLRAISQRPKNANELADELDVDYKTVRHHLDMLIDHGVVEASDEQYARLHFLTDEFQRHRETFEEIAATVDVESAASDDSGTTAGERGGDRRESEERHGPSGDHGDPEVK